MKCLVCSIARRIFWFAFIAKLFFAVVIVVAILAPRLSFSNESEPFTIVVIPDIQTQVWEPGPGSIWQLDYWGEDCDFTMPPNRIYDPPPYGCKTNYTEMIQWIVDNVDNENIKLVTQVGDIVQTLGSDLEWTRSEEALGQLDDAPNLAWSTSLGNHDFDEIITPGTCTSVNYIDKFGPARHSDKPWFGGSDIDNGGIGLNTYQRITSNGREYLHISLEMNAPNSALDWAQGIINENPGTPTIITTHEMLNEESKPPLKTSPYLDGDPYKGCWLEPRNSGKDIWDKLIDPNPQIFMTFNGHLHPERLFTQLNEEGLEVFHFQINYPGKDTPPWEPVLWTRLMRFDEELSEIRSELFSFDGSSPPDLALDPNNAFIHTHLPSEITLKMDWNVRFGNENAIQFQQGIDRGWGTYDDGVDTWIDGISDCNVAHPDGETLKVRGNYPPDACGDEGEREYQGLIAFYNIIGDGSGQIAPKALISKAILTLTTSEVTWAESKASQSLHRMLIPWEFDWSFQNNGWGGNGVQTNDLEASATADDVENFPYYYVDHPEETIFFQHKLYFDVTETVQAWANGELNYGWVIKQVPPVPFDTWELAANEHEKNKKWRPLLTIVLEPTLEIAIDIKPGSDPNCFNINGHGVIPVAILGGADLNVQDIVHDTLLFAGLEVRVRGNKGPLCHFEDTNSDSYLDLVCQFEDDTSNWAASDTSATLTGFLLNGKSIKGTDSICVVP